MEEASCRRRCRGGPAPAAPASSRSRPQASRGQARRLHSSTSPPLRQSASMRRRAELAPAGSQAVPATAPHPVQAGWWKQSGQGLPQPLQRGRKGRQRMRKGSAVQAAQLRGRPLDMQGNERGPHRCSVGAWSAQSPPPGRREAEPPSASAHSLGLPGLRAGPWPSAPHSRCQVVCAETRLAPQV